MDYTRALELDYDGYVYWVWMPIKKLRAFYLTPCKMYSNLLHMDFHKLPQIVCDHSVYIFASKLVKMAKMDQQYYQFPQVGLGHKVKWRYYYWYLYLIYYFERNIREAVLCYFWLNLGPKQRDPPLHPYVTWDRFPNLANMIFIGLFNSKWPEMDSRLKSYLPEPIKKR